MTPAERAALYNASEFGRRYTASRLHVDVHPKTGREWVSGVWTLGNNYRSASGFYGSYPPGYLPRVQTLFPDADAGVDPPTVLHLFSGSVPPNDRYCRVDLRLQGNPHPLNDVAGDARRLSELVARGWFRVTYADTPYGPQHAARYGCAMPSRLHVLREVAAVTRRGGHLVWLDTKLPMFSAREWRWWGTIMVVRSTNHDVRGVFLFERR